MTPIARCEGRQLSLSPVTVKICGMDENPYKAPSEHGDESPVATTKTRRVPTVLFAMACLGMAAFFAFVVALLSTDFVQSSRRPKDWSEAALAAWGLLNAATWVATAAATWTNRQRVRTAMLFADLFVLLSIIFVILMFS